MTSNIVEIITVFGKNYVKYFVNKTLGLISELKLTGNSPDSI